MENTTDALYMAGSVLLLIIALTVCISSLSKIKTQTQEMLLDRNQIQMAKEGEEYINYLKNSKDKDKATRTVGIETIISAIRRMQKEKYNMFIQTDNEIIKDFQKNHENMSSESAKVSGIYFTKDDAGYKNLEDSNIIGKLYHTFKDSNFKEYYGFYKEKKEEEVPEDDRLSYRIITFVEIK